MALIPSDVGLRIRLDNEILPQPVPPVQEIAAELPRMQAGQVFSAQIRDVLPGNTYLALVAGKTVTLSLPDAAKSGDVLDLVVVEQTPKAIVAQLAGQAATSAGAETGAAYQHTRLSRTAQMLSPLLTGEGETPAPATLNRGQPLLAQPPRSGAELVPVLSKAVTESGLFYEAHQAQWVAGKLPLRSLLQEPQGQHSAPAQATLTAPLAGGAPGMPSAIPPGEPPTAQATAQNHAAPPVPLSASPGAGIPAGMSPEAGEAAHPAPGSPAATTAQQAVATPELPINKGVTESLLLYQSNQAQGESLLGQSHSASSPFAAAPGAENAAAQAKQAATSSPAPANVPASAAGNEEMLRREGTVETARAQAAQQQSTSATTLPIIPDDLRALVQQQLDAAGTQRLLWHGEVWPGQQMQWQLEWQDRSGGNGEGAPEEPWATTLKLNTPRLGQIEASLHLGVAGVRIALATPFQDSAADMRSGAEDLKNALEAAGVPLRGFSVRVLQDEDDMQDMSETPETTEVTEAPEPRGPEE